MQRSDDERFERLKSELQLAFAQPESSYRLLELEDIIQRNESAG